jgi:hypothetical protein
LKPSTGAGWGVFATRPIKRNALILNETAVFATMKSAGEEATENDVEKIAVLEKRLGMISELLCVSTFSF